jgi:hypothetical protein
VKPWKNLFYNVFFITARPVDAYYQNVHELESITQSVRFVARRWVCYETWLPPRWSIGTNTSKEAADCVSKVGDSPMQSQLFALERSRNMYVNLRVNDIEWLFSSRCLTSTLLDRLRKYYIGYTRRYLKHVVFWPHKDHKKRGGVCET